MGLNINSRVKAAKKGTTNKDTNLDTRHKKVILTKVSDSELKSNKLPYTINISF